LRQTHPPLLCFLPLEVIETLDAEIGRGRTDRREYGRAQKGKLQGGTMGAYEQVAQDLDRLLLNSSGGAGMLGGGGDVQVWTPILSTTKVSFTWPKLSIL